MDEDGDKEDAYGHISPQHNKSTPQKKGGCSRSGPDDGASEESHRPIRDPALTVENMDRKMLCVTRYCLLVCESTPTIHPPKSGSCGERLSSSIVTLIPFRYGVSTHSLTYSYVRLIMTIQSEPPRAPTCAQGFFEGGPFGRPTVIRNLPGEWTGRLCEPGSATKPFPRPIVPVNRRGRVTFMRRSPLRWKRCLNPFLGD